MSNTTYDVKHYELSRLEAEDIFTMVDIINKIGFAEFKSLFNDKGKISTLVKAAFRKDKDTDDNNMDKILAEIGLSVAMEAATIILRNLDCCKNSVYKLLARLSKMSVDEIRHLDAVEFMAMLMDFFKKEELKDFIKVVSKFLK